MEGGGGLGIPALGGIDGALGAIVAGRGAGVGTRGTAGAGTVPGFFVISKRGLVPAGVCGAVVAARASASACTRADIVTPLGNVSVNLRRRSSSSLFVPSSPPTLGRGATGGLPNVPVGNFGAGGIVGD